MTTNHHAPPIVLAATFCGVVFDGCGGSPLESHGPDADVASADAWSADMAPSPGASAPVAVGTGPCAHIRIESFNAQPPEIAKGDSATLSWQVTGARGCILDPDGIDKLAGVGQLTMHVVSPPTTTTYMLTCYGSACLPGSGRPDAASTKLMLTVGERP